MKVKKRTWKTWKTIFVLMVLPSLSRSQGPGQVSPISFATPSASITEKEIQRSSSGTKVNEYPQYHGKGKGNATAGQKSINIHNIRETAGQKLMNDAAFGCPARWMVSFGWISEISTTFAIFTISTISIISAKIFTNVWKISWMSTA